MGTNTKISEHEMLRTVQMNLTSGNLIFLMNYGRIAHCGVVPQVVIGRRDVPAEMQPDDAVSKIVGTKLILANDDLSLITVYYKHTSL